MIKNVEEFLLKNIESIKNKTFALAYSGGIDSNVMLHILYTLKKKLGFNLIIIHVNYNLRGVDSINDETFARNIAYEYNINIYVKSINPNNYRNVQIDARNDRYRFFKELYNNNLYDYLLIAHNRDDLAETIIYRMIKGSGTDVYKSLRKKKNYILRPLLDFYRKDIEKYAYENNLTHREDSSNKKNYYARNKIRNIIIPLTEEINSKSKENIILFAKRTYIESKSLRKKVNNLYKNNISENNKILNLKYIKNTNTLIIKKIIIKFLAKNNIEITDKRLKEILKIINSNKANIKLRLDNFYFVKEYDYLKIKPFINENNINCFIKIEKDGIYDFYDKKIEIKTIKNININYKEKLYIKHNYPLVIRSKKDGDFINTFPNGNKKYLRNIFKDLKIPIDNRNNIPIIESNKNEILAIYLEPYSLNRISKNVFIDKNDIEILEINLYD